MKASLDRRQFLKMGLAAGTGLKVLVPVIGESKSSDVGPFLDTNVNLSSWLLRRLACDSPSALVAKARSLNITQAWAGTFDGLLHKDISGANARLAEICRRNGRGLLVPFGSINLKLPGWEGELRRCAAQHRMRGIRVHPNYHGYTLTDPRFARLLALATELCLIVQLTIVMEDERMMHPLLRVTPVETDPLPDLVKKTPGLRMVLLNALRTVKGSNLRKLIDSGEVYVDLAMLEGVAGIENLLREIPTTRLLFGTHAPLFYFESAILKLRESRLTGEQLQLIASRNATRLLEKVS